jgi:hypothetical protein
MMLPTFRWYTPPLSSWSKYNAITDLRLPLRLFTYVYPVLGLLLRVDVGDFADVSVAHAASTFWIKIRYVLSYHDG